MGKMLEYSVAVKSLDGLKKAATEEYLKMSLREKVEAYRSFDMTFLGHETDGGFLYEAFPEGGWGYTLTDIGHFERHQTIQVTDLIDMLFEGWYDNDDTAEESEEKALIALETGDAKACKVLRAVLNRGVCSFEFDW